MQINKVYNGKEVDILKTFPDNIFDSSVADGPYGLKFMGKKWDYQIPSIEAWMEVYRTLKPGAYLLAACGTRTQHRMACNIEDAGFEIRDVISWIYGSGFPKSLDISKAIDKQAGAEREVVGKADRKASLGSTGIYGDSSLSEVPDITAPATDEAKQWEGWGTALKPAQELWTLARKPLSENTVAENVLKHGTGGINIDGSRIPFDSEADKESAVWGHGTDILGDNYVGATHSSGKEDIEPNSAGRFPANIIVDEFTGAELDKQAPKAGAFAQVKSGQDGKSKGIYGDYGQKGDDGKSFHDGIIGGASRFFYCAKADTFERNKGCENLYWKREGDRYISVSLNEWESLPEKLRSDGNIHPTVKPLSLMRYLVKLITPKGGIVLDPYIGSGTTGAAAKMELINYVGIDMAEEHCIIAEARIAAWNPEKYKAQTLF